MLTVSFCYTIKKITTAYTDSSVFGIYTISANNKIPVVSVVVGGGIGTIDTVRDAIKAGTPAVIIEVSITTQR